MENKTLGAGNDTFDSLNSATSTTLNAGDVLVGGDGTDRLAIVSSINGGTLGQGVQTTSVEQLSVNAVGATTVDASLMAGVTDVYNTSSLNAVTVTGLTKIANVHVVNTNQSTTATFAADAVVGVADATTVLLNGAATTANSTVTVDGIETINLVAAGTASGSATSTATVTSNALTTLNITGVSAVVSAGLPGATATVTGTVTSDAGAHDVEITGVVALDKLSVSMLAGNDTVRISTIAATHTINGGDGTDTLVSTAAITTTTGANISGFEAVSAGAVSVALPTGNLINAVTFTGTGGSVSTVLSGATVSQAATGTNTVSNTAWTTGTADALTVNVGAAGTAAGSTGAITQNLTATGIETATINNLQNNDVAARTVGVTGANLKTLTVNSANTAAPITISATAGGTALTAIDASNVAGVVAFAASATNTAAAGFSLKTGAGADALTGFNGADTLDGGAGNDTITGGLGIDSLTGGGGVDTFIYGQNVAGLVVSSLAAPDVIADFVSGTDKLQILNNVGGVATAPTAFLGNYPSVASAQAAVAADGRTNLAYFVTSDKQLYVTAANTGIASATDTVISLPNTATLAVSGTDLQLGSQGANTAGTIALSALAANLSNTVSTNVTSAALTTGLDDTISSTGAFMSNSTINGGNGVDTLNISGADATTPAFAGGNWTLNAAAVGTGSLVTNVEVINFAGNTGGTLTVLAAPGLAVSNSSPTLASNVAMGAGANQTFTATGTGVNTVAMGAGLGQSVTLTGATGIQQAVTLGGPGQIVSTGIGNDLISTTQANSLGSTFTMGAGTADVLALTDGGTYTLRATAVVGADSGFSGVETITTSAIATVLNVTPAAALAVTSGNAILTVNGTGTAGLITVAANAANALTLQGTSNFAVTAAGAAAVGSTGTGTLLFTAAAGISNTITSSTASTVTLAMGAQSTAVTSFGGTSNVVVTGLGTVDGTHGVTELNTHTTGTLTVGVTGAFDSVITLSAAGTGAVIVNDSHTGVAAELTTLVTNGGARTITVNISGATGAFTATGASPVTITSTAGAHAIVGGGGADTITGFTGNDSITGGVGADRIDLGTGGVDVLTLAPTTDTGAALGFTLSQPVPANLTVINVGSMDIITNFGVGDTIDTRVVTNSALGLVRNGGTMPDFTNDANTRDALIQGNYDAANGLFTVSLAGTSSMFVYDMDGDTAGVAGFRGVILVGYVDGNQNDTLSAAGVFTSVA